MDHMGMEGYQPAYCAIKESRVLPKGASPLNNKPSKRIEKILEELDDFSCVSWYQKLLGELREELGI